MNNDCPNCHAESADDSQDPGDILICIHCGYIGIWDEDLNTWRPLRPDEHARCMESEAFLDSIQFGIAFRTWRERDRTQMCAAVHSRLDRVGVAPEEVEGLVDELMAAGYHTHPNSYDLESMGIDKHGDSL